MIYTIGNFLLKGISFFTVPIFTQLLNPSDYGKFSVYSTFVSLLSIFMGLGINGTLGSAKGNLEEKEYREYLSSVLTLSTISFVVFLIISIIFGDKIGIILGFSKNLVILLVFQSFSGFIISFITAKYTFDKEPKKYLTLSFITTLINIIFSIILILNMNSDKYIGRILGTFISVVFIALFLYIKELRTGKVFFSKKYWLFCLPISIPIIFHNLSHLVLNQADRLMLDKLVGDSATGIYSFTYNIGIILNIVNMSINSAWVAWYFDALKDKLFSEIRSMVKNYIVIFTIITGLFLLGAPELVKILSAKTYWGGINLLPIIILGYYFVFLYTFAVNYEFYSKKTKFIALGTIIAAIINIVINVMYIPKIGVYAAAISTLVAYIILFAMHEFIVRIILKHKDFPFYYYLISIGAISLVTIVSYIFIEYLLIRWSIIIICLILCGIIGYREFKKYKVKKRGGNGDE